MDKVTRTDIEDFLDYLRNEKSLSEEYPKIFQKLLKSYPIGVKRGQCKLVVRGDNTLVKLTKKLKAFFVWLYETDKTKNRPFDGIKIGSAAPVCSLAGSLFQISVPLQIVKRPLDRRAGKPQLRSNGSDGRPAASLAVCPILEVHIDALGSVA